MHKLTGYLFITFLAAAAAVAEAKDVEVTLQHNLDGYLNGYCFDVVGGGRNIDPSRGLQAHTCYSYRGDLGSDQIFDSEKLSKGSFYMPEFNVCAELENLDEGAKVGLTECKSSDLQNIELKADGTIRPTAAPTTCFTVGLATSQGRGGTSAHQIKTLTLEACADDKAIFQQWRTRSEND